MRGSGISLIGSSGSLLNTSRGNRGRAPSDEREFVLTGYKAGVIDPTKVTRTALQNAASIASLMLTTEAMVCGIVEEAG